MGICCQKSYNAIGDEYLARNLKDLNLWDVRFEELKEALKKMSNTSNRIKLATLKEHKLFKNLTELQKNVLNGIFIEIADESFNFYKLCFYLLPFLSFNYDGGKYFYEICYNMNQNVELKIRDYEIFLKKFYVFALITSTKIVKSHAESEKDLPHKDEIIKDLDYRLERIWTEKNINKEINEFIKTLDDVKNYDSDIIVNAANRNLNFKNSDIRIQFLSKYQFQS
jgi:hypothetical protein